MSKKNLKAGNEARFRPLLSEAQAGNRKAYQALLSETATLASHYVRRKTGAHGDTDDIVQEILISIHKALHTYDPARPCMPWLAAIMHYRVNDWLRAHYAAAGRQNVPLEEVEEFLTADVTEEPLAYEYVNKAVAQLSEGQQAVIHSMYHQELTVAETGKKLNMSISAVKVTAHRAYKKLRKHLEDS